MPDKWKLVLDGEAQSLAEAEAKRGRQYRVQFEDHAFYLLADEMKVEPDGTLIGVVDERTQYAFAAGQWLYCLPISCLDGEEILEKWYRRLAPDEADEDGD